MAVSQGTKQIIYGGLPASSPSTTAVSYATIHSGNSSESWASSSAWRRTVFPVAVKVRRCKIVLSAAPGAGAHYQFSILKNAATQGSFVTISGTDTEGIIEGEWSYAAGDDIEIRCDPTIGSTPATTFVQWGLEYETQDANTFVIHGSTGGAFATDGTLNVNNISGGSTWVSTGTRNQILPLAATIEEFRIKLSAAPGVGNEMTFTFNAGGATRATVVISGTDTEGVDTSISYAAPEGTVMNVAAQATGGTPSTSAMCSWALLCTNTNVGESAVMGSHGGVLDLNGGYVRIKHFGATAESATEDSVLRMSAGADHKLYNFVFGTSVTMSGATKTLTLRKNSSDTALAATVADGTSYGEDSTNIVEVSEDDLLSLVYSETAAESSQGYWGFIQYVQPDFYEEVSITEDVQLTQVCEVSVSDDIAISEDVTGLSYEPIDFSFLQATSNTSDLTTYTFSSQNLGAADSARYIIVGIMSRKSGATTTIDSVTVGGVSATIVRQVANNVTNTDVAGIAIALVPTGTTGDIVVTFGAGMVRCAISVYRAVGISTPTPFDHESSTAGDPTVTLDIPERGIAIGVGITAAASTASWTGLIENFDTTLESFVTVTSASGSFNDAETGRAITVDFGSSTESVGVFASWEPIGDYVVSVFEDISIVENVTPEVVHFVSVNEALSIAEDASVLQEFLASAADVISIAEDISTILSIEISLSEVVSIAEDVATEGTTSLEFSESISITESVETLGEAFLDLFEAVTLEEDVSLENIIGPFETSVSDAISIEESVGIHIEIYASIYDLVTVEDDADVDQAAIAYQLPLSRPRGDRYAIKLRGGI